MTLFFSPILLFFVLAACFGMNKQIHISVAAAASKDEDYHIALIGKQMNNPFFDFVFDGCHDKAVELSVGGRNVTCHYYGTLDENAEAQARIVDELVELGEMDGISLSVINTEIATRAIQRGRDAGIPVVTFDSDAPESARRAYIGTDNFKFGRELGKLLLQLDPQGGKYGVVAAESENVQIRVRGILDYLKNTPWTMVADSPKSSEDRIDTALEVMWEFAADPEIKAILSVGGWPMWSENWTDFVDANRHLMLISGDSLPVQLELINKRYVNALVGQLPYNMGESSVDVLMQIIDGTFDEADSVRYGTEFLEILLYPLILPPIHVDNNYLGGLVWLGYLCFGIILVLSIGFSGWTYWNRTQRVVVASQPPFLYMICLGTLVTASTILLLTFDDNQYSEETNNRACMCLPWLESIGFTTTFAALFSKLWRVNRIFHNPNKYRRVVVHAKDVIYPYAILMGANLVVLITWTLHSPLQYVRINGEGTDGWNRVIYTYGGCQDSGGNEAAYLVALLVINLGVLILANYQAYEARTVSTEFSESRYIAIIMASILQACVVGVPVLILIRDQPIPFFVVSTLLLFITCLSVLLLIFLPKINYLQKARRKADRNQPGGDGNNKKVNDVVPCSVEFRSEHEEGLRVRVHQPPARDSFHRHSKRVRISGITGIDYKGLASSIIAVNNGGGVADAERNLPNFGGSSAAALDADQWSEGDDLEQDSEIMVLEESHEEVHDVTKHTEENGRSLCGIPEDHSTKDLGSLEHNDIVVSSEHSSSLDLVGGDDSPMATKNGDAVGADHHQPIIAEKQSSMLGKNDDETMVAI